MYEYKVVPAPKRGEKAKGIKTPEDRFAMTLQELMNAEATLGWEFVRAETLPSEEKSGFRSSTVVYRSVLMFRKAIPEVAEEMPHHAPVPAPSVKPFEPEITPEISDLEEPHEPQESSKANA